MAITNHILAGAIIGLTLSHQPAAALALAFASHFLMDALPHFGYAGNKGFSEAFKYQLSYIVGAITLITATAVLIFLVIHQAWFAILAGLVAASPDAVGLYNWVAYEKKGRTANGGLALLHVKFHRRIQTLERPWGVYVEALTFGLLVWLLLESL